MVGTIEAVGGEIVEVSWVEFQVRALKSADFLIEESLKGDIAAERIELSFGPTHDYYEPPMICGEFFLGFEPGYRMILMLGQADEDGRYRAPWAEERFVLGRAEEIYRDPSSVSIHRRPRRLGSSADKGRVRRTGSNPGRLDIEYRTSGRQ